MFEHYKKFKGIQNGNRNSVQIMEFSGHGLKVQNIVVGDTSSIIDFLHFFFVGVVQIFLILFSLVCWHLLGGQVAWVSRLEQHKCL